MDIVKREMPIGSVWTIGDENKHAEVIITGHAHSLVPRRVLVHFKIKDGVGTGTWSFRPVDGENWKLGWVNDVIQSA